MAGLAMYKINSYSDHAVFVPWRGPFYQVCTRQRWADVRNRGVGKRGILQGATNDNTPGFVGNIDKARFGIMIGKSSARWWGANLRCSSWCGAKARDIR